jgi:hypothetical protein
LFHPSLPEKDPFTQNQTSCETRLLCVKKGYVFLAAFSSRLLKYKIAAILFLFGGNYYQQKVVDIFSS